MIRGLASAALRVSGSTVVTTVSIFAPAKLNLFLAVTGRRADGFHDLVSVAAPLGFGDSLRAEVTTQGEGRGEEAFALACDDPALVCDESNLVLKAARAFAEATGWRERVHFSLEKRIPAGAGLGGGSSDAVAALRALNALAGEPLAGERLAELAARLGSDCPLFLRDGPVVMRGRGERIEALPEKAVTRLAGRRVLVFKPAFGISTPWAYAQMVARPESYVAAAEAETRLAAWLGDEGAPGEELLFNNLERVAFAKFLALPALFERLRGEFGLAPRMSGSGSACFAFVPNGDRLSGVVAAIRAAWGESAFVVESALKAPGAGADSRFGAAGGGTGMLP